MRRSWGALPGTVLALSLTVSLALSTVVWTGTPALAADEPGPTARATGPAAPEVTLGRASRDERIAAREVDLPRPVRGGTAIRLLGEQVDEAAALNDLDSTRLVDVLQDDPTAWLDTDGMLFYKEEPPTGPAPTAAAPQAEAAYPLDQTFLLHSKAGSQRTIYLDFNGAAVEGTAWNASNAGLATSHPEWDRTGTPGVFDSSERTDVQAIWESVAEDYAPFDVDVTTEDPGAAAINRSSSSDQVYGSLALISPSASAWSTLCQQGCGGVAYTGVFGTASASAGTAGYGYYTPAWVFPQALGNSPKNIAEAISHEVGHNLGLTHDGNATQGYDTGHGAWAPIMGVGYYHPISQWSKGDYAGANNQTDDDVAVIRAKAGTRTDESGSSVAQAAALPSGTAYVASRTDVDTYLLGTCSGAVGVTASPLASQANLDVKLSLLTATGTVVATNDPASAQSSPTVASGMGASLSQTLASGTYYVQVDGVGNGTWAGDGYDDYGSLGAYTIARTGTCNGVAPTGTPSAPVGATASGADTTVTVAWSAPTSAGSSAITGYSLTRSGDDTPISVPAGTTSYAWTGLERGVAYTFTVTPINAQGPGATATATTTLVTTVPSVPQGLTTSWNSVLQRLYVSWSPPASNGGSAVSSYAIYLDGSLAGNLNATGVFFSNVSAGTRTVGIAATNAAGTGPVASATQVVPARAANDAFAGRTTISGASGSIAGDNLESSAEAGDPTPPGGRAGVGGASVWYRWTAPASGPVTFSTTSTVTGRDTTLGVYTGTALGALTTVAANDEASGSSSLSTVTLTATAGTTYVVAVDGFRTAAGAGPFGLTWSGNVPATTTTTTLATPTVSGRSVGLTATVTGATPAGTVQFSDGGTVVATVPVAGGTASATLTDLVRGDHLVRASFVPTDPTLHTASQSATVTATIAATSTATALQATADAQNVTFSATVTPSAGTAAGTVQFREDSTVVASATVSGGGASVTATGVTPGAHSYTASFVPADLERYAGSTSSARSVTVAQPAVTPKATTTTLTGQVTDRTASLTATVAATGATPVGTVELRDGTTVVASGALVGGSVTLSLTDLTRGNHPYRATFVPADATAFGTSQSAVVSLVVAATPTTTALTAGVSGRTVTLRGSVSPSASGIVELREGTTLVGTAAPGTDLVLTGVPAGDHVYTAVFVPADDLRFATSTSTARTVTVVATPTTTVLGSSVADHAVTLSATVTATTGAATGSVTFREGDAVLATVPVTGGTAATTLDVATGDHTYTATFAPTDPTAYAASTASRTVTVAATATTTSLTADASGRTVTLTAGVTASAGTPAGQVVFREGGTTVGTSPLGGSAASLSLPDGLPGPHTYTATFVPTGTRFAGSTSAARTVTVRVTTTTTLTASATGRTVVLDSGVTAAAGTAAGTVELRDAGTLVGTATLTSGAASLTLADVTPGAHSYAATFVATDPSSYAGSTSATQTVTVAKVATSTGLSGGVVGRTVTLTAPVTGSGAGQVTFREGATTVGAVAVSSGSAVLTLAGVAPGAHAYTATFSPTDTATYAGSTSPERTVTVAPVATSTALGASASGRTVTLNATATSPDGPVPGQVVFREGSTVLATTPVTAGAASLTLTGVTPGSHAYTASFEPTAAATYAGSASPQRTVTIQAATGTSLATAVSGRSVTLSATVTSDGSAPVGDVVLRDGSLVVGTVAVASGAAAVTLTAVTTGTHAYRAEFVPADASVHGASVSGVRTVDLAASSTSTALTATVDGSVVRFEATVTSAQGSPVGAVEVREGGTVVATAVLTDGLATTSLTGVATGSHTYTAVFVPADTTWATSSSAGRTVQVVATPSAQTTTTGLGAAVLRRTVTLTATVGAGAGTPAGTVELAQDGTVVGTATLTGGTATLVLTGVGAGERHYTATFVPAEPTAYAASSSGTVTRTVLATVTMTALDASLSATTATLTATVAGTDGLVPTGTVELVEGGTVLGAVALVDGRATLAVTGLTVGTHTYLARYRPATTDFATSTSSSRSLSVAAPAVVTPPAAAPPVAVLASTTTVRYAKKARAGSRPTVKVVVLRGSAPATGVVVLRYGSRSVQVALKGGVATVRLAKVKSGTLTLTASYAGDATTRASVGTGRIKVR